jgi:hypothetical protein
MVRISAKRPDLELTAGVTVLEAVLLSQAISILAGRPDPAV